MTAIRPLALDDTAALTRLIRDNREFLAPWESVRDEGYFTEAGQRAAVREALTRRDQGTALPYVITDADERVVGRIGLNTIVAAPTFLSASVGYWVGARHNGRGHATAALRQVVEVAFTTLGLHRVQAETLVHNEKSQRILAKAGFVRYGLAPRYLKIAGSWQDCVMFQTVNDDL